MNTFIAAATATATGVVAGSYYAGAIAALWVNVLAQLTPVLG